MHAAALPDPILRSRLFVTCHVGWLAACAMCRRRIPRRGIRIMSAPGTIKLSRLFVIIRQTVLTTVTDAFMGGAKLLLVTGASGVGKTTFAALLREELAGRSVPVLQLR